jgi:hypothetical protein
MKPNDMTRKQFVRLTFTLLGGAAAAAACSSSTYGGSGATGGSNGSGGTTATGGAPASGGSPGAAGSAGGNPASTACADPLPETQVPDSSGHTHSVTIPASDLDATSDQTIDTSVTFGHMHAVTLAVADLAMLKAGGQVTVMSSVAGTPPHSHAYNVSCQPV